MAVTGDQIKTDLWSSLDGRALLWAVAFDATRLARVAGAPLVDAPMARAARREAEATVRVVLEESGCTLLDAHDALVYLNVFVEAQWGFKGWPGLVLARSLAAMDSR